MTSYNLGQMAQSLEEIQDSQERYTVTIDRFHNSISDIICFEPIYSFCIPIYYDVIASLFRSLHDHILILCLEDRRFSLDIYKYKGMSNQLQYRITGFFMLNTVILHGEYHIQSFVADPAEKYQLKMLFDNGKANGECVVFDGSLPLLEKILFVNDNVLEKLTFSPLGDINQINIFNLDVEYLIDGEKSQLISVEERKRTEKERTERERTETRENNLCYLYRPNGIIISRKYTDYDNSGNQIRTELYPNEDFIMERSIIDKYGRVLKEEMYDKYKIHPVLTVFATSRMLSLLSSYRDFTDTGLLSLIRDDNLFLSAPITLTTLIINVKNNILTIIFDPDFVRVGALSTLGYLKFTFDYLGELFEVEVK